MARKLKKKKVMSEWMKLQIHTTRDHLITPLGKCTARLEIKGFTYVSDFIVQPECSRELIIGIDFLQANGANRALWFNRESSIEP